MGNIYNCTKPGEPKKYLSISFPITMLDEIKEVAQKQRRSANMQVITMLERYMQSDEYQQSKDNYI